LIALAVQILAPVGACWAAAMAASDPLPAAEICRTDLGKSGRESNQSDPHRAHDGACVFCCVAQASAALDTPPTTTIAAP